MTTDAQWTDARRMLIEVGFPLAASGAESKKLASAVADFQEGFAFGYLKRDGDPGAKTLSALQASLDRGGACAEHFGYREFASKGNSQIKVKNHLALGLEHARAAMGGAPVKIESGFRDPRHNRKIGGSPRSQHLNGGAADVDLATLDVVKSWGIFTGIGARSGSERVTHVDVRPGDPANPTMWRYLPEGGWVDAPDSWQDYPVTGHGLAALEAWPAPDRAESVLDPVAPLPADVAPVAGMQGAIARGVEYVEHKGFGTSDTAEHLSRILQACSGEALSEPQTAYVLATALHESHMGRLMEEIASGASYEGRLDLGNTQPGDGVRFKGRGYVQLTGRANYQTWTRKLQELGHDVDLIAEPDQAKRPGLAAIMLARGMRTGAFTGRSLDWFVNDSVMDFEEARRVVNGKNNARRIAGYANHFLDALRNEG